ncbi:hypothetical protein VTI74DRAFT_8755 [Chaetomium olivicolor]
MPTKRASPPSDSSSEMADLPLKRTQRTHEENQERAYIAASRRADRDIEHRIRSALKASECRKKRTGRGLKITREAVLGDEQYESDDEDDATRRFRHPAGNLSNPLMANRADRYAEIDALFAKHFPNVQLSSRWPQTTHHQASYLQQQPLHGTQPLPRLQTSFVPRYQQPAGPTVTPAPAPAATQPSPLLTPPVSYPLPPAREGESECQKSGSVSPLALEGSPATRSARPLPSQSPQQAPIGLGIGIGGLDAGVSAAVPGYVIPDSVDPRSAEGSYLYSTTSHGRTASAPSAQALLPPMDLAAAGAVAEPNPAAAWYPDPPAAQTGGVGTSGSGWNMRSLSLPTSLEAFHFPGYEAATAGDMAAAAPVPVAVDAAGLVQMPDGPGAGSAPNEPWAEWVNLDGPGPAGAEMPTALGAKA